jgi:prepilin-type N-terminal cleavage/methylation domain-containing protein
MKARRVGFTLVELAIVLVIFGLIASLVLPSLKSAVVRGKTSQARATLQATRDAVLGYGQEHWKLPGNLSFAGTPQDPWLQQVQYRSAPELIATTNACTLNATSLALSTTGGPVSNMAFLLQSAGEDRTLDANITTNPVDVSSPNDDLLLWVSLEHLKTLICPDRAGGTGGGDPGAQATWSDILTNTNVVKSGPGNLGAQVTPTSIVLGVPNGTSPGSSYGCVWYTGNLNSTSNQPVCTGGNCTLGKGLRAYFTFTVQNVGGTLADGFTFAIISAQTNSHASCGGRGSALGYASTFIQPGDDGVPPFVLPPKAGVEFDFYTSGSYQDPGSHQDHLGIVYWGNHTGTTDLARGQDDLRHNFGPTDGGPSNPNWVKSSNQTYFDETGTVVYPVRIEMVRNATAGTLTTHVWFGCGGCGDLTISGLNGPVPPGQRYGAAEYFNHTATFNATWNPLLDKILLGWTEGTGTSRQRVTLTNASFFFPE